MLLLNTTNLQLCNFRSDAPPPYATFSASLKDGNVVHKDFCSPQTARQKPGFQVLQRACSESHSRGLSWLWNDAVCIDRSTALSQSLNSLAEIYRKGRICIVYLHDLLDIAGYEFDLERVLSNSSWFKHVWMLPHLIFSTVLHFYDAQWNHIGGKWELIPEISRLTSIDEGVLRNSDSLKHFSDCTKMSWAAGLSADLVEDAAYSLIGIFDVNLSINYGEGMVSFIRLQEEVLRRTTDYSLLAWRPETNQPYRGLLAYSPLEYSHFRNKSKASPNLKGHLRIQSNGIHVQADIGARGGDLLLPLYTSDGSKMWIVLAFWDGIFVRNCTGTILGNEKVSNFSMKSITVSRDVSPTISSTIAAHHNGLCVNSCDTNGTNGVASAQRITPSISGCMGLDIHADSKSTTKQFVHLAPGVSTWPRSPSLNAETGLSQIEESSPLPGNGSMQAYVDRNHTEDEYPSLSKPLVRVHRNLENLPLRSDVGSSAPLVRGGENTWERNGDSSYTRETNTANTHIARSTDAEYPEAAHAMTGEEQGGSRSFGAHGERFADSISTTRSLPGETTDGESSVGIPSTEDQSYQPNSSLTLDPGHPFAAVTGELKAVLVDRFLNLCTFRPPKRKLLSWPPTARKRPRLAWSDPYMGVELDSDSEDMDAVVVHHAGGRTSTFICPYYLMDKKKHQECLTRHSLPTIGEVKEHMWESHRRPNFCPICKTTFATMSARDHHIRGRNCEHRDSPTFDGLTDAQIQQLARQASVLSSRESQWYELWDVVFPSGPRPVSPYYSSEQEFRVVALRSFWEANGRDIISDFLKERGLQGWEVADEERSLAALFQVVLHDAIDDVYRRFSREGDGRRTSIAAGMTFVGTMG